MNDPRPGLSSRRASAGMFLAMALVATPAPAMEPAKPAPTIQKMFEDGAASAKAGRHADAIEHYRNAIDHLRAQGRIASADAGLIGSRLALSLEAVGHPQTDEAYEFAVRLLEQARDAQPFVETAAALIRRRLDAGEGSKAQWVAEKLLARATRPDTPKELVIKAIQSVVAFANSAGENELGARAFDSLAALEGDEPLLLKARGVVGLRKAKAAQTAGRLAEARQLFEQAAQALRRSGERIGLAGALMSIARLDFTDGRYAAALPFAVEAEAALRDDKEFSTLWIEALGLHARLLERLDRKTEALSVFEAAESRISAAFGADSNVATAARLDRVGFLVDAGKIDAARAALKDTAERLKAGADGFIAALFYDRLAKIRLAETDFAGAAEAARESLRLLKIHRPDEPANRIEPARKLAAALAALPDRAAAEDALKDMIAATEAAFSPAHPEVARDLNAYALFLQEAGRMTEAEALQRRVLEILSRAYGEQTPKYAYALNNLAVTLSKTVRFAEARPLAQRAVQILAALEGTEKDRIGILGTLAGVEVHLDPQEALRTLNQAVAILAKTPGLKPTYEMKMLIDGAAALAYLDLGNYDEAWRLSQGLITSRQLKSLADAANFNQILMIAAIAAEKRENVDEALALSRQAGEAARQIGQTDRAFTDEWAGLLARYAWRKSRKEAKRPAR